MVINEEKQEITLSFEELKTLVDNGLVADRLLLDIEFKIGHHIKTGVSAGNLKVVKTDQKEMLKEESTEELYARTIKATDTIIASNELYEILYWGHNIEGKYQQWCTPELFDYFELNPEQATAELRAAMYPNLATFYEGSITKDGETYRVPYIIFIDKTSEDGKFMPIGNGGNAIIGFYLNSNRNVHIMRGEISEVYESSKFSGNQEWKDFFLERKKELNPKKRYIFTPFTNIKLGETVYTINQLWGSETHLETKMSILNRNPQWYKVRKGLEREFCNATEMEKQAIVEKGRNALEKLRNLVLDLSELRKTPDGRVSKTFKAIDMQL